MIAAAVSTSDHATLLFVSSVWMVVQATLVESVKAGTSVSVVEVHVFGFMVSRLRWRWG